MLIKVMMGGDDSDLKTDSQPKSQLVRSKGRRPIGAKYQ